MKPTSLRQLCLDGMTMAPSQVLGGVRLVPLLRETLDEDLRLALRSYDADLTVVDLGGGKNAPHPHYFGYVPHGLVVRWTADGTPATAFGAQLAKPKNRDPATFSVGIMNRMARREEGRSLRMLPLHVAMEGFLDLYFGGPEIAWSEYSRQALSQGLSPRWETSYPGSQIAGLRNALRLFEIHQGQCGAMVFVADALAAVTIVSHPEDYRILHRAMLEDFYGELIWQYGLMYQGVGQLHGDQPAPRARSLADLRRFVQQERDDAARVFAGMAAPLFDRAIEGERIYRMGPFSLERFMTDLDPQADNHIGECIRRSDGSIAYLKTFRLSAAQTRRAYLLSRLAAHDWELAATAAALQTDEASLVLRLRNAGFGYLLHPHVLERAQKRRR